MAAMTENHDPTKFSRRTALAAGTLGALGPTIATERKYGAKFPSLMWGHSAPRAPRHWFDSIDSRTPADHARAVARHKVGGGRNEDECPGPCKDTRLAFAKDFGIDLTANRQTTVPALPINTGRPGGK